jgi:hypothetical protein
MKLNLKCLNEVKFKRRLAMIRDVATRLFVACTGLLFLVVASGAHAASPNADRVIGHWTPERINKAIPRDLVIDHRGYGYMRRADGSLDPYGHNIAPAPSPKEKPSGGNDSTPPDISNMHPAEGNIIDGSHTFSATITDESGIKSVSFVIHYPSGLTQSFSPSPSGDIWSVTLTGFADGNWAWHVVAKDNAGRGGNTATSPPVGFTVDTSSAPPPPPSGDIVDKAEWIIDGGIVQTVAGRVYFEMPADKRWKRQWVAYVCSGTVATDTTSDRSIILTAAHCVYDDNYKAFARNVLFIPNQAGTTGAGTDTNCNNDPLGCWVPSFGVVDVDWTTRKFPDNIKWDYAYYVVETSGAHSGPITVSESLEAAAGSLPIDFTTPFYDDNTTNGAGAPDYTHALGYSYSDDPNLMYCAEDMTTEGAVNWWLPSCNLSGGSSGGPWVQSMVDGDGLIISVNSWGYTTAPGMAGPQLDRTTASRVFDIAGCADFSVGSQGDGYAGVAVTSTTNCPMP